MRKFMRRIECYIEDWPMLLTMPIEILLTIVYATVGPLTYFLLRMFVGRKVALRFEDMWEDNNA